MRVGVVIPQGWTGEYDGWDPGAAWERSVSLALQAERLGFESTWAFDHFTTVPDPTDEITFESFTFLSALAALTQRVRLGHMVACTAFRNPALTAKMISTMDVLSRGRMELGLGAGWKEDEWRSYGYEYPRAGVRLGILADHLEIIGRMLAPGRATYEGEHAHVTDAINMPKPIQHPRLPIIVGGNGPNVTWRLAAKHADELNVDGMLPDQLAGALPVIRSRCEEIGRDPTSLRVSVHYWWGHAAPPGPERIAHLAAYRELGVSRVITILRESVDSDEALEAFASDAVQAGAELNPQLGVGSATKEMGS